MSKEHLFSITKKDFDIRYFSGSGAGGQHRNKHQNCVRLRHIESGVMATGQSHKERPANLKEAFQNLIKNPKFKFWMNLKIDEIVKQKTIEQWVDEQMEEKNLKIEVRDENGKWVEQQNK